MKKGGQALLGGLDICVSRNFFGAQINSFEAPLPAHQALTQYGGDDKFRAVFIRAPAVVDAGPQVRVGNRNAVYILVEASGAASKAAGADSCCMMAVRLCLRLAV
jgi:glutamine amidotransferase PdxT